MSTNTSNLEPGPTDSYKSSELHNVTLVCKICNLTLHAEEFTYDMIDAQRFDYKFDEGTRTLEFICKWCLDPSHTPESNIIKFHGLCDEKWLPGELPRKLTEARKILKKVEALYNDEQRRYYEDNATS